MAADCEINDCGVMATGRCVLCGRAFCESHRSAPTGPLASSWPHAGLTNACLECQQQAIKAQILESENSRLQIKASIEKEHVRVASLPPMTIVTLIEYFRSHCDSSTDFRGEKLRTFSSSVVADALQRAGCAPESITLWNGKDRPFSRKKTRLGWLYRKDDGGDDRRSWVRCSYLLTDGTVLESDGYIWIGKPRASTLTPFEIKMISTGTRSRP